MPLLGIQSLIAGHLSHPLLSYPTSPLVFALVHKALFGLNLGIAFAPNHKGMLMPAAGARLDHLHKQVLTSRDVTGGAVGRLHARWL
jgi:hypothetical protein